MPTHPVVSSEQWTRARKSLLQKEKDFLKARDELSRLRRELPWERVEKRYVFDTTEGEKSFGELFAGRSQLCVYHFMYAPDKQIGCRACSFWADSFDHVGPHLAQRDVTFLAVSRGPLESLLAMKKRLGWSFEWVSSGRSDFNYDYQASIDPSRGANVYNYAPANFTSEREGISVFYRDADGSIFHTYSTYARGIDNMNAAYQYLDLVPKGRDEGSTPMAWLAHRDRYENAR